jgi:arabinogalactan endo-1,4-beta-galactosidase
MVSTVARELQDGTDQMVAMHDKKQIHTLSRLAQQMAQGDGLRVVYWQTKQHSIISSSAFNTSNVMQFYYFFYGMFVHTGLFERKVLR